MRPFSIPGARTPLQRPQHLPYDRQHQNNEHRVSGPPADAVHSRSSYSKATPSGSFCSNQVSAASGLANTFKCSLPFRQSGFLLGGGRLCNRQLVRRTCQGSWTLASRRFAPTEVRPAGVKRRATVRRVGRASKRRARHQFTNRLFSAYRQFSRSGASVIGFPTGRGVVGRFHGAGKSARHCLVRGSARSCRVTQLW